MFLIPKSGQIIKLTTGTAKYLIKDIKRDKLTHTYKLLVISDTGLEGFIVIPDIDFIVVK